MPPAKCWTNFAEPDGLERFRERLFITCVDALANLRQQRFFKKASGRSVFLLFSVSASEMLAAELAQIISRLKDK